MNLQIASGAAGTVATISAPWEDFETKAALGIVVGVGVWVITTLGKWVGKKIRARFGSKVASKEEESS